MDPPWANIIYICMYTYIKWRTNWENINSISSISDPRSQQGANLPRQQHIGQEIAFLPLHRGILPPPLSFTHSSSTMSGLSGLSLASFDVAPHWAFSHLSDRFSALTAEKEKDHSGLYKTILLCLPTRFWFLWSQMSLRGAGTAEERHGSSKGREASALLTRGRPGRMRLKTTTKWNYKLCKWVERRHVKQWQQEELQELWNSLKEHVCGIVRPGKQDRGVHLQPHNWDMVWKTDS